MDSVFLQIGVVTIVAALLGIFARTFRQPILLAYITAGILLGSAGLGVIHNAHLTQDIATIGIIFLLFLVGLELDVGKVRRLRAVVLAAGLVQMLVTGGLAYAAVRWLGYGTTTAIFLGLAATFSSTAVVLKRLTDRRELTALYAKITIGILLLQDIVAILALMIISGIGTESAHPAILISFIVKGVAFLAATWLFTKYALGRIFFYVAKSPELLFLTSVAWAFLFAIISDWLGFSKEIGAFLAGISLATLPYNLEIISRVRPLRDFFLVIFFVVLGLEISWPVVTQHLPLIALLSAVVLLPKSFITAVAILRAGYPKRPAYLTGAALGQTSEFSLLIVLLGYSFGQVSQEVVGITAAVLVVTITLNTYWNNLNRFIYPVLSKPLSWLGGKVSARELQFRPKRLSGHTLIFGANRSGYHMLKTLERAKKDVLVVDHNPEVIRRMLHRGVPSVYGDIDDFELMQEMGLAEAEMVISTVPNVSANLYLIKHTREHNQKALIIMTAEQVNEALAMYHEGADYVILPHLLGGEQAAHLLEQFESAATRENVVTQLRKLHIRELKQRQSDLVS